MRRGILGSIAAVAAGAGAAWGQPLPMSPVGDPPPPGAIGPSGGVIQVNGPVLPPGLAPTPPAPVIMPPLAPGPTGDPQGFGPVGDFGPPPGPMYPNPGAYGAQQFEPGPSPTGTASGAAPHVWFLADYMLYFSKSQPINYPLLTTSAPNADGLLGQPSTLVLAGGRNMSYNPFSGYRITTGFFGDADRRYGFEFTGFTTENASDTIDVLSTPTGIPTLARPFIDSMNPAGTSSLVLANPSLGNGRVIVDTTSQLYSVEANGILNIFRSAPGAKTSWTLDLLGGYRFLQLKEDLSVTSGTLLDLPNTVTPIFSIGQGGLITQIGSTTTAGTIGIAGVTLPTNGFITIRDDFQVTNRFNGGQLGLRGEVRHGMFTVTTTAKIAIGDMREQIDIRGTTSFVNLNNATVGGAFGGLLANASNIGRYTHDEFTYIPELNVNVGLNVTKSLTAFIGYNYLYIDKVARPGTAVNPNVNSSLVPFSSNYGSTTHPSATPNNLFAQDTYWLMGINFGVMLRY